METWFKCPNCGSEELEVSYDGDLQITYCSECDWEDEECQDEE